MISILFVYNFTVHYYFYQLWFFCSNFIVGPDGRESYTI